MAIEQQLRAYVDYLRDMGVYDLYQRQSPNIHLPDWLREKVANAGGASSGDVARVPSRTPTSSGRMQRPIVQTGSATQMEPAREALPENRPAAESASSMPKPPSLDAIHPLSSDGESGGDRGAAMEAIRADIGECTRCPLAYAGRRNIVFGEGDPSARLMFVGEGPGADEDESGRPFVGKAGQLLNNMIAAMGLRREEVYIANIVKCRPPANRVPEFVEATTCSQFLARQIDVVRPEVIVALGATAATYLLGVKQPLSTLRGVWHNVRGAKVAVTYHPAFLLRDPRQKGEAWKDLQRVMAEMGLQPKRTS